MKFDNVATVEDIQERIIELEILKVKKHLRYRYENSEEYIQNLIDVNKYMLNILNTMLN
jgi:hypothetical protein